MTKLTKTFSLPEQKPTFNNAILSAPATNSFRFFFVSAVFLQQFCSRKVLKYPEF